MKTHNQQDTRFAVCITDAEPDLEIRKIYRVIPDASAAKEGHLRIVDESGEDYLYPATFFAPVVLSKEAERAFSLAS